MTPPKEEKTKAKELEPEKRAKANPHEPKHA